MRVPPFGSRTLLGVSLVAITACLQPARDAASKGQWSYDVDAPAEGSRIVKVRASFENLQEGRLALTREAAPHVENLEVWDTGSWRPIALQGSQWSTAACVGSCRIRYSIDLDSVASACADEIDCASRVDDSTLSPALTWLIHPQPKTDVPVTVRVHTPNATQFMTGMSAPDDAAQSFAFRSFDLDEGSFTAFGPMRRYRVDMPAGPGKASARIDVSILGRHEYAMSDLAMKAWVEDAADAVTGLFGRFPVDRASLFVVPAVGESDVVFGKVLSLAGASIAIVVGDQMPAHERRHDWVLVHELFHLGFPTFRGEGRWLGEGLATYYEPILRARSGWQTGERVFREFARNMPRGVALRGSAALAQRDDLDSVYWGGALFCLATDVRIREETHGRFSLDHLMRAILAKGGDATKVWTVAEVVALGDTVTGTKVMSDMYDRHAARGERIDLDGLLVSLGIMRGEGHRLSLNDASPLAWVRRDITAASSDDAVASRPANRHSRGEVP